MSDESICLRSGKRLRSNDLFVEDSVAKRPRKRTSKTTSIEEAFTAALASIQSPALRGWTYERLMECAPEIVEVVARGEMLRLLPQHIRTRMFAMIPLIDRLESLEVVSGGTAEPELRTHAQADFRRSVLDSYSEVTDVQDLPTCSSELKKVFFSSDRYRNDKEYSWLVGSTLFERISAFLDRFPNLTRFVRFGPFSSTLVEQKETLRDYRPKLSVSMSALRVMCHRQAEIERVMLDFPIGRSFPGGLVEILQTRRLGYLALCVKASDTYGIQEPEDEEYPEQISVRHLHIRLTTDTTTSDYEELSDVELWAGTQWLSCVVCRLFCTIHAMFKFHEIESLWLEVVENERNPEAEFAEILIPMLNFWSSLKDFRILPTTNINVRNTLANIPGRCSLPDNLETFVSHSPVGASDETECDMDGLKNLKKLKHLTCVQPCHTDQRNMEVLRRLLTQNARTLTDLTIRDVNTLETLAPIALMTNLQYIHIDFSSLDFTVFAKDAVALIPATVRKIIFTIYTGPIDYIDLLWNNYADDEMSMEQHQDNLKDFMDSFDRFKDSLEVLALQRPILDLAASGQGLHEFLVRRLVVDEGRMKTRSRSRAVPVLPLLKLYCSNEVFKAIKEHTASKHRCRKHMRVELVRDDDKLFCEGITV